MHCGLYGIIITAQVLHRRLEMVRVQVSFRFMVPYIVMITLNKNAN